MRLRHFVPLGILLTSLFGTLYMVWAAIALRRGNVPFAIFYALFGTGGIVLAVSLWNVWREMRRRAAAD